MPSCSNRETFSWKCFVLVLHTGCLVCNRQDYKELVLTSKELFLTYAHTKSDQEEESFPKPIESQGHTAGERVRRDGGYLDGLDSNPSFLLGTSQVFKCVWWLKGHTQTARGHLLEHQSITL